VSAGKAWAQQRAKQIEAEAKARYGAGWQHMSEDARQNFIDSRVLSLILAQVGEAYGPAQELARSVIAATTKEE
jgi:hypothetical protein